MKISSVEPVWVEFVPDQLEEGKLYISEKFSTVIHKCCCGCGEEVVTPLSPVDWRIFRTQQGVTLHPSIGNWSYPCQSHYFIRNSRVVWAGRMTATEIRLNQQADTKLKAQYIEVMNKQRAEPAEQRPTPVEKKGVIAGLINVIWSYIRSFF